MSVVKAGETKTGLSYVIRYPQASDVQGAWEYVNKLSKERTFVTLQGEEVTLEEEKGFIDTTLEKIRNKKAVMLLLVVEEKIVGISDIVLQQRTESHVGVLGISVGEQVRGQGLGEILLRAIISEAQEVMNDLKIITLRVKGPNTVARSLYLKSGFKEYGILPGGTMYRGQEVDEVMMYLRLLQ